MGTKIRIGRVRLYSPIFSDACQGTAPKLSHAYNTIRQWHVVFLEYPQKDLNLRHLVSKTSALPLSYEG